MSRGYYGIGIYQPKTAVNVGTLWRSAMIYDAAFVFTVGRRYEKQASDTMKVPRHIPLLHFVGIEDLIDHLPHSCPLVGVELDPRARSLADYAHPERAAYLLGAEDNGISLSVRDRCHALVEIPSPTGWCLNVAVAGSLLLHDRYMQRLRAPAEAAA